MSEPEFIICNECDSPVYVFEWRDGRISEAICATCGNAKPALFMTDEEYGEDMASDSRYDRSE
jgi:translation initiation factor 2 beta subunit (eIF-2beta)/eIF-5